MYSNFMGLWRKLLQFEEEQIPKILQKTINNFEHAQFKGENVITYVAETICTGRQTHQSVVNFALCAVCCNQFLAPLSRGDCPPGVREETYHSLHTGGGHRETGAGRGEGGRQGHSQIEERRRGNRRRSG